MLTAPESGTRNYLVEIVKAAEQAIREALPEVFPYFNPGELQVVKEINITEKSLKVSTLVSKRILEQRSLPINVVLFIALAVNLPKALPSKARAFLPRPLMSFTTSHALVSLLNFF